MLVVGGREISRPHQNVGYRFEKFEAAFFQEIILLSGVFRRETASGFYPCGKVDSPRKRVAEGLCGWRHGNSFPMTQSAQSHRQMRSIPHCPKDKNRSPFHGEKPLMITLFLGRVLCQSLKNDNAIA